MTQVTCSVTEEILRYCEQPINCKAVKYTGDLVNHGLAFPIDEIIAGVHAAVGLLIAEIWKKRGGCKQTITIDITHAYLSLSSVFLARLNGYPIYPWDPQYPTVGLYPTKDEKYIFINGGYPALRDRVLKLLKSPNDKAYLHKVIQKKWNAVELEEAIAEVKGCAAVVREKHEWLEHPQGKWLQQTPVIQIQKVINSVPEPLSPKPQRPLQGIKVLDLTWVVAAPTCARVFAEHGADVLHISAAHLPHIPPFVVETGNGKREAYLDLRSSEDLTQFKNLLRHADIFVEGWRPGIMEHFGLTAEEVQKIRPGIIHIQLSCYGTQGPFAYRAGWEQLGQAVSGIIASHLVKADENEKSCAEFQIKKSKHKPVSSINAYKISDTLSSHGILVCDYTSGILGAVGGLNALIKRGEKGGGYHIEVALARSGMWLISKSISSTDKRVSLQVLPQIYQERFSDYSHGPLGKLQFLTPVVQLSETPPFFAIPSSPLGSGEATWL